MAPGCTGAPQLTGWHLAGQAAAYLRQSSEEQRRTHVGSAEYQKSQVEHLKALGFPEDRIRLIDEDQGQSGTSTRNRTGFLALKESIEAETVRVVAVTEISRLGRNDLELAEFLLLCESKGVILVENGIPRDVREVSDWCLLKFQGIFAELENRRRNRRIQSGRLAKSRLGIPTWRLPCGFDRGPNGEAVKTTDPIVRGILERVWREALQGWSAGRIVKGLRAEGVKLPARDHRGGISPENS